MLHGFQNFASVSWPNIFFFFVVVGLWKTMLVQEEIKCVVNDLYLEMCYSILYVFLCQDIFII